MKTERGADEQEAAEINELADDVTEGKLKNVHQVEKALLQIEPRPREYGKPARKRSKQ